MQERCRFDGEEKENTGAASGPEQFVWTDTGAFPRGNRSWRENTGRQEHGERIKHATKFFGVFFLGGFFGRTGGQRKLFFVSSLDSVRRLKEDRREQKNTVFEAGHTIKVTASLARSLIRISPLNNLKLMS